MTKPTNKYCIIFLYSSVLLLAGLFCPAQAVSDNTNTCLICHGDEDLEDDSGRILYVNKLSFLNSIHGESLSCVDCHTDFSGMEGELHDREANKPDCGSCHDGAAQEYRASIHSRLKEHADGDAPGCTSCHDKHYLLSPTNPNSFLYRTNQAQVCGRCHEDAGLMTGRGRGESVTFVKSYEGSIHGVGVSRAGLKVSAVCSDCHGAHNIVRAGQETSPSWRSNIPKTCGKCHIGVYRTYKAGIHGRAFFDDNPDAPVCTDCHGEHTIQRPGMESASVYATHIPQTCSRCHDDIALDKKYGLPSKRLASFLGSYHGIALSLGDARVANCASCHGYHDILPSSDPESSINPANLQATCGSCHPQAGRNFSQARIHITNLREQNIGVLIVKNFYKTMIGILVFAFIGLIVIDLNGHVRRKQRSANNA